MASIQQTAQQNRKRLLAHDAEVAKHLQAQYHQLYPAIQHQIDVLMAKLQAAQESDTFSPSWLYEQQRLQTLLHTIQTQVDHYGSIARGVVSSAQSWAAQQGTEAAQSLLHATVPKGVKWSFGVVPPKVITEQMMNVTGDSPLAKLFATFGDDAAAKAKSTLILHTSLGSHPSVLARQLRQDLQIPLQRATVMSRTSALNAYRSAHAETFRANSDILSGWRWTATKSANTCAACLAMDGQVFDLDTDMSTHPQCRCIQSPISKGWADILDSVGIDGSDIEDVNSPTTWQTGSEWFAEQDAATQRSIIGSDAGMALIQSGDATLDDFLGTSEDDTWGRSIYQRSVKQVKRRIA